VDRGDGVKLGNDDFQYGSKLTGTKGFILIWCASPT
jgi:hypothetical protein